MKTTAVFAILLALLAGCQKHTHVPTTPSPTSSGRSVVLTWEASATAGATYNVYRFAGACAGAGPGTKLTAAPIAALTYTDPNVPADTLCYWTTAFLATAASPESVPSNKAEITILQQPEPPRNLQISPTAVTMQTGTTQLFRSSLSGTSWSIEPPDIGAISASGLYTAPATIQGNNVRVQVTAHSGDQTATADVTIRKN